MFIDDIKKEDINFDTSTHKTPNPAPITPNAGDFQSIQPTSTIAGPVSFWDDAAEGGDFEDLKPGTYPVTIISAEVHNYKNGGRGFEIVTKLTTNGQQDWTYLTFEHSNPVAVGMGKRDLKAIFTAFGLPLAEDLTTMLGHLKSIVDRNAELVITWARKKEFNVKDALGNDSIRADYDATEAEHHYINKKIKPV